MKKIALMLIIIILLSNILITENVDALQPTILGDVYIDNVLTEPQNVILTFPPKTKYDNDCENGSYSFVFPNVVVGSKGFFNITYNDKLYIPPEIVTIEEGTDTYIVDLHIYIIPIADAGGPYTGTKCSLVSFTGSATGGSTPYTWDWNFGDGTTHSSLQNSTHHYTVDGSYTVTLTVTDDYGVVDTDTAFITISTSTLIANAGGPYTQMPDVDIQFTGSATGGCPSYSWNWNFGDGTAHSSLHNPIHQYTNSGTYTTTLTVTDSTGIVDTDTASVIISIINSPPTADAGGPYTGNVNTTISMTGSSSSDTDGTITGYRWDYTNDGTYDTTWLTSPTTNHIYTTPGTYTIKLEVKDNNNATDIDTTTVEILTQNNPLIADAGGPYTGTVNTAIQFSGSASGGTSYTWAWNFGDGTTSTSQNPTHTYTSTGTKTVTLTVTSGSNTDTDTVQVTVNPTSGGITADAHGPYSGYINTAIQFTGSATGGTTYIWSWNFGDGTTSTSQNPTHTYTSTGTKTVTLIVTSGSYTSSDTASVSVSTNPFSTVDTPPIADAGGPYTARINQTITFNASASNDPDSTITGYRWDWTNDSIYDTNWSSSPTITHRYTNAGTYTVKLQVKDNYGAAASDIALVTISQTNNILQADAGGPYYEIIGISIQFDGSDSYNPKGTDLNYKWSFGDGNTSTSIMPTHTYYKEGNYTIKLTITDSDNKNNTDTTFVIVTKEPNHPPETPTISGITSSHINTKCNYTIKSSDIEGDKIQYIINWNDGTNLTISPILDSNTVFNTSHSWSNKGIYRIIVYTIDENNATSENKNYIVLIDTDAHYCSSLGYLVDKNGDGTYEVFYSETTGIETNIQKNNSEYNIDINDDQKWDYTYNFTTNKISEYDSSPTQGLNLSNMDTKWIILPIILICIIAIIVYIIYIYYNSKNNEPKKIRHIQEKTPELEINKKYSPTKNKIYAFTTNDEKTKKMHEDIDKILSNSNIDKIMSKKEKT